MREKVLAQRELHGLLAERGHTLGTGGELDTDVFPPQQAIVTVAVNPDPCQVPAYRERYFATIVDGVDCNPALRSYPEFALPEPFAMAQLKEPVGGRLSNGNFLLGPFRWLLCRLTRFPHILLWPENQIREKVGFVRADGVLDEMPRLAVWLQQA